LPFLLPFHLHTFWMVACPTSRYKFFSNPSNSSTSIWSSFFLSPFCLSFTSTILADRLTMASVGWLVAVSLPPPPQPRCCLCLAVAGRPLREGQPHPTKATNLTINQSPQTSPPHHPIPIGGAGGGCRQPRATQT
jgi:hypothetical protein